jgi:epoxyqueuosine reductase
MFGCDVCQDVCPWNRFSKFHNEKRFLISKEISGMTEDDWDEITEEAFKRIFSRSALKRTGYKGIKRNLEFLRKIS